MSLISGLEDLFAPQEWVKRVKWVYIYPLLNSPKPKHIKIKSKEDTWQNEFIIALFC